MAKRKKSKGQSAAVPMSSGGGRSHLNVNIEEAENGYVVNASGSSDGGDYWSKRYIAKDRPESLRISNSCLASGGGKGGKKKSSGKKKVSLKRG